MWKFKGIKNTIVESYRHIYHVGTRPDLPIMQGKDLACHLGYDPTLAQKVPESMWARFFPCGNLLPWVKSLGFSEPRILNLGAGIGLDTFFLTFGKIISRGLIVNVDTAEEALRYGKAFMAHSENDKETRKPHILWVQADGERIPFRDEVFHIVLMNGVFNLFEDKHVLLREVFRVLRRPGSLLLADLVRIGPLPPEWGTAHEGWLWCINGSLDEHELEALLQDIGFSHVKILRRDAELEPLWREVVCAHKRM